MWFIKNLVSLIQKGKEVKLSCPYEQAKNILIKHDCLDSNSGPEKYDV